MFMSSHNVRSFASPDGVSAARRACAAKLPGFARLGGWGTRPYVAGCGVEFNLAAVRLGGLGVGSGALLGGMELLRAFPICLSQCRGHVS
jgi:hypothetical protein